MNAPALRRTASRRAITGVSALLAVTFAALWVAPAMAQAPAWPTDQRPQQPSGGAAWPTDKPSAGSGAPPSGAFGPPAQPGGFSPAPGGGGMSGFGAPGGMPPGKQAELEACNTEFTRLRAEVDKKGAAAKAISQRKGSREELCTAVTGIYGAMGNWAKYAKSKASACSIPPDVTKQLDAQHTQLNKLRTQICSSGPAAGGPGPAAARPPSLSEALGTSRLPADNSTTTKRGGALDTLTGNPIR